MSRAVVAKGFAVVLVFATLAGGLWRAPIVLYPDLRKADLATLSEKDRLDAIDKRSSLQSSSRAGLAQALGGLILLWGALAAWTQYRHDAADRRLQRKHDQEILLSEQFSAAVGFLAGSASDIRVAAVFVMGQIAESSPSYRPVVAELLSAFVRTRSNWPPAGPRAAADAPLNELLELRIHAPDVQAAMQVLGRHTFLWYGDQHLRFRYADLRRVNLGGLHFEKAAFTQAHMERAWLPSAKLRYASFRGADLTEANLDGADLRDANLRGAALTGASLEGANLRDVRFDETTLWPAGCPEQDAISRGAVKGAKSDRPTSVAAVHVAVE